MCEDKQADNEKCEMNFNWAIMPLIEFCNGELVLSSDGENVIIQNDAGLAIQRWVLKQESLDAVQPKVVSAY